MSHCTTGYACRQCWCPREVQQRLDVCEVKWGAPRVQQPLGQRKTPACRAGGGRALSRSLGGAGFAAASPGARGRTCESTVSREEREKPDGRAMPMRRAARGWGVCCVVHDAAELLCRSGEEAECRPRRQVEALMHSRRFHCSIRFHTRPVPSRLLVCASMVVHLHSDPTHRGDPSSRLPAAASPTATAARRHLCTRLLQPSGLHSQQAIHWHTCRVVHCEPGWHHQDCHASAPATVAPPPATAAPPPLLWCEPQPPTMSQTLLPTTRITSEPPPASRATSPARACQRRCCHDSEA